MKICITGVKDAPSNSYLSVKVGDTRRQGPLRLFERFRYPGSKESTAKIDLFTLTGNTSVDLSHYVKEGKQSETLSIETSSGVATVTIEIIEDDQQAATGDPNRGANTYLEEHGVQALLQSMVHSLLRDKPSDPGVYLIDHIKTETSKCANFQNLDGCEASNKECENDIPVQCYERSPEAVLAHEPNVPCDVTVNTEEPECDRPKSPENTSFTDAIEPVTEDVPGQECTFDEPLTTASHASVPQDADIVEEQMVQETHDTDEQIRESSQTLYPTITSSEKQTTDHIDYSQMDGLGDSEYTGFSAVEVPDEIPDLSEHHSIMAEIIKNCPDIYHESKNKVTPNGVTFAKVIKTGMDNKGHPMIKTVGMIAGDEESYETFKSLLDPVIQERHNGYHTDAIHTTDLDADKLDPTVIDPTGKYAISTRVRTGRSLRGFRLPPSCSKDERRDIEGILVNSLLSLEDELQGDYYPLAGSYSYDAKPGGMLMSEETEMRDNHFLFQEPDSTLLLSSGMGRHWPDGRGIFTNSDRNFLVWVNEEDHMRIISMQMGSGIKEVFSRFVKAVKRIEEVIKEQGKEFMHTDHLGYILTCPSNLGTGLRASVMVKLPNLSARGDFKDICSKLNLQARGGSGVDSASEGGKFDISNIDRLGKSEVELVNVMIKGCAILIEMESKLEGGDCIQILINGITNKVGNPEENVEEGFDKEEVKSDIEPVTGGSTGEDREHVTGNEDGN